MGKSGLHGSSNDQTATTTELTIPLIASDSPLGLCQPNNMPSRLTVLRKITRLVCRVILVVLQRFWLFCSSASLFLLLSFWFYGGLVTLALLHVAVLGACRVVSGPPQWPLGAVRESHRDSPIAPGHKSASNPPKQVLLYLDVLSSSTLVFILCDEFNLLLQPIGLLYNAQDMLLFYPDQPPQSRLFVDSPRTVSLAHETLNVRTSDGVTLNMFLIKQPPNLIATAPTFVYFHGNAGNIGHRLVNAQHLFTYCQANVLLVEYRGYGRSSGTPSEHGLYLDGQAAMDYILSRSDINQQQLIVFGRSLGGAVAIHVCSQPYYSSRVAGLVVENTFTTLPEMGRAIFNFRILQYLPDLCHKNKFPSRSHIAGIAVPSLFLSGLQDDLVPPRMMQALYESSASRMKHLALFPTGTHNETWHRPGYYEALNHFLTEMRRMKQGDQVLNERIYLVQ